MVPQICTGNCARLGGLPGRGRELKLEQAEHHCQVRLGFARYGYATACCLAVCNWQRLEKTTAEDGLLLTEKQIAALERKREQ